MSAGKEDTPRPFDRAKWDASKLWKKPNMNDTPRTDIEVEDLSAEQFSDLDAYMRMTKHARQLERELAVERATDWRALIESEVANLRAELANERDLADRLAGEIGALHHQINRPFTAGGVWTKYPVKQIRHLLIKMTDAYAAWSKARNPAQTTTEGAE